jgi:hypothetical protein
MGCVFIGFVSLKVSGDNSKGFSAGAEDLEHARHFGRVDRESGHIIAVSGSVCGA